MPVGLIMLIPSIPVLLMRRRYRIELLAFSLPVPRTSVEVIKICYKFLSAIVALGAPLRQAKYRRCEARASRETADVKLKKANSTANRLTVFRKRQAASAVSM